MRMAGGLSSFLPLYRWGGSGLQGHPSPRVSLLVDREAIQGVKVRSQPSVLCPSEATRSCRARPELGGLLCLQPGPAPLEDGCGPRAPVPGLQQGRLGRFSVLHHPACHLLCGFFLGCLLFLQWKSLPLRKNSKYLDLSHI